MNVADYICKYLLAYQVKHIFGYPGGAILPLMESIQKHPDLHWVLMRHEGTAALAASAYSKSTGKLSVCMASTGPGASNLLTGLLDAHLDRAAVLVITGLLPTVKHGLSHFQEMDHVKVLESGCGFSARAVNPMQAIQLLQNAIGYIVKNKGVAHVAIALDVQSMELTAQQDHGIAPYLKKLHSPFIQPRPPAFCYEKISKQLSQYTKIVLAVGGRTRPAGSLIEALSEKLHAPIICTFPGKGVIHEDHPNYFGVLGMFGSPANAMAFRAISEAELVISFCVDDILPFLTTHEISQQRDLIQCDIYHSAIFTQFVQQAILLGPIDEILENLLMHLHGEFSDIYLQNLKNKKSFDLKNEAHETYSTPSGKVDPKYFFKQLNPLIENKNIIIPLDIGDHAVWAVQVLQLTKGQKTIVSNRLGTMGFCLPAMIAAKLAHPDHTIIGICGDGGFQMVLGEWMTVVQEQLNIYLIVINNGKLQRVAEQQGHLFGVRLENPNFTAFAKACGTTSFKIQKNAEIKAQLKKALAVKKGPVLIDVHCDPVIYAPMVAW